MAILEIAQIQNTALKAAALEVDESGKKDGYIDSSEINLFTEKATALLNEKKCTSQEFATLFATNDIDKTNTTDVFAKVDSLHNAKNTPEALAKEAEETKRAEKQEKVIEIKAKIAKNDEKLKLYEKRLAQKEISRNDYYNDIKEKTTHIVCASGGAAIGLGYVLTDIATSSVLGGNLYKIGTKLGPALFIAGLVGMIGFALYTGSNKGLKNQEKYRNAYKEAYLKVSQENEQLKAQLAELQNS